MRIIEAEQRSPEWFEARRGKITASNFDKIVTIAGLPSKQREKMLYQTAGELISGIAQESFKSSAMERGILLEPEAISVYEFATGEKINKIGLCVDDDYDFGASPDGMVGEDGLLEIKCPAIHTHVEYLINGVLPSDYIQQVQGQLLVTGRKWCDFVSYYPGIKPLVVRVLPEGKFQKLLRSELIRFCEEVKQIAEKIK